MIKGIEAIAIDLDGTLLNSEHKISDFNKEMIFKVREKGIKVFIATGRLYKSLYKYKKELDIDTPVICYNGAMVVDGKTDEKWFEVTLDKKIVKDLVYIARENNIHLNLFHGDEWYVEAERNEVETYKSSSGLDYHLIEKIDFENLTVNKAMYVGENEKLLEIEKILEGKFGREIYKAFSKPYFLEILDKSVSKGDALLETLKRLKINPENVMAFGDGFNDLEMLNGVGMGIAMGNSPKGVLEQAKYAAETNDEDGVGKFIEKYFEIL